MAWKDEAYEIGRNWARVYEPASESRKFLETMFDSWFLVNVVHNDFKSQDGIFEIFLGPQSSSSVQVNGSSSTLNGISESVKQVAGDALEAGKKVLNGQLPSLNGGNGVALN